MFELLYEHNSLITHSIEALAVVIGFFYIKKHQDRAANFFIAILIYLFFVDTLGAYPKFYNDFEFLQPVKNSIFKKNKWWFTIFFDVIAIILFSLLYQKILKNRIHKMILKFGTLIYFIISIILISTQIERLFNSSFPILYVLQTIIILCCAIFYFLQVIKSETVLIFYKSLYFYISVAIFIWWLIITPLVFFDKYFISEDKDFILLKRCIYIVSNIFMYSTFSIGLLVSKPEETKE